MSMLLSSNKVLDIPPPFLALVAFATGCPLAFLIGVRFVEGLAMPSCAAMLWLWREEDNTKKRTATLRFCALDSLSLAPALSRAAPPAAPRAWFRDALCPSSRQF